MPVAIVTGTSTGIGLATAVALARAGYRVHATMRSADTFQMALLLRCDPDIYARPRAGPPSNVDAGWNEL